MSTSKKKAAGVDSVAQANRTFLGELDLSKSLFSLELSEEIIGRYKESIFHRRYKKKLDFPYINKRAKSFAVYIRKKRSKIISVLQRYESYEVACDETERALDFFDHLEENQDFFIREIGSVTAFLPRNQPLYALTCFAIIPSLMAKEVHVRPPLAMDLFFADLILALSLHDFFPNIHISFQKREDFLQSRSALILNQKTHQLEPITDAVIFTGTMENADKIRQKFDDKVLFIANGAGHNPIVIAEDANIKKGVQSAMRVQLYNQGQDCANPNAILVHTKCYKQFVSLLETELAKVKVGSYKNKSNRVGPISDRKDLKRIQEVFVENAEWIDPNTEGTIHTRSAIVQPTIVLKPLKLGGNFVETFAPIFFIQKYEKDEDLKQYFEDPRYERNAMYVTLFGKSAYVDNLIWRQFTNKKILHDPSTIVRNTDLHAPGIERGTKPYGGYGRGSSCISIYGRVIAKPTCPQRDIFDWLVYPALKIEEINRRPENRDQIFLVHQNDSFNLISTEDAKYARPFKASPRVENKIASVSSATTEKLNNSHLGYLIKLRDAMNFNYAQNMSTQSIQRIQKLKEVFSLGVESVEALKALLYEIPKTPGASDDANKEAQKQFFKDIYNLLFGMEKGPKLHSFLWLADKDCILNLLGV